MKKTLLCKAFAVAALAATGIALASCGKKSAASDFVFKIGTANSSLCGAPLHVAIDLNLFKDEFEKAGLKYETIEIDLMQASSLVVAGKIDGTLGLAGGLLPQIDNGLEIQFLNGPFS